ncbi:hypothetical protein L7F22_060804 [Adiantum nelumboides]|nr:hypothetical protein [Adiantum nelumboides]
MFVQIVRHDHVHNLGHHWLKVKHGGYVKADCSCAILYRPLGRYKLSTQLHTKADAARAKVAQEVFKEAQTARQEALQKKKHERRKALESIDTKLSVEAVRKREEKERLRQMKKAMPRMKISRA